MSPRARRSESVTLPPGNHPGLIRYNDDKSSYSSEKYSEKATTDCPAPEITSDPTQNVEGDEAERIASASASEASDDSHDFNDSASDTTDGVQDKESDAGR